MVKVKGTILETPESRSEKDHDTREKPVLASSYWATYMANAKRSEYGPAHGPGIPMLKPGKIKADNAPDNQHQFSSSVMSSSKQNWTDLLRIKPDRMAFADIQLMTARFFERLRETVT